MAKKAIESDFRSSKMAQVGLPKWPPAAILKNKIKNIKAAYWSEMARNAIKSDFQSSKMAAGSHFVKKKRIDLKWREMPLKVIFGNPKWPPTTILYKKKKNSCLLPFCDNKSCVLIWNDRKWFSVIQNGPNRTYKMAVGGHLKKNCCILPFCEMARNVIESDFQSSKIGGGGGGHHNGRPVNHSGIYTVFALGQIHQF